MHVSQAMKAPKFVNLPSQIVSIVLDTLGKGHLETLMRISLYLWGPQVPLEGAASEFCETMVIHGLKWQRHIPELGRSGVLRYRQPQYGFYVLAGFPRDATLYKACVDEVLEQIEKVPRAARPKKYEVANLVDDLYASKPSKMTVPIVVNTNRNKDLHEDTATTNLLEGGVGGSVKPSKLTVCSDEPSELTVCDPVLVQVMRLYEQEIGGTVTAMMADDMRDLLQECRDVERWRYAFRQSLGTRNRWRYARAIILHPERQVQRGNGRGNSKQDSGDDSEKPGGASADIDAWFDEG